MKLFKKKEQEEASEEIEETKEEIKVDTNKERKIKWQITEVATQTQPALINTETNETVDVLSAMALILNKLDDIEQFLST